MPFKYFFDTFFNPDAILALVCTTFLTVIHFLFGPTQVGEISKYIAMIFGAVGGFFGVCRMYEMWRYERAHRIIEEHKIEEEETNDGNA